MIGENSNIGLVSRELKKALDKYDCPEGYSLKMAGMTRLRPILMTAMTTIIAMLPMAFGFGSGSDMMQPMALVVEGVRKRSL